MNCQQIYRVFSLISYKRFQFNTGGDPNERRTEDKLTKATRDCSRASIELIHGLMAQVAKDKLFNSIGAKK